MDLSAYVGTLNLLGDESRIRLCALLRERELSVTDLVRVTGISQSRVSTHLARLREGGFVRDRRDGQHSFYALAKDSLPGTAKAVLDEADARPPIRRSRAISGASSELDAERRGALPESFAGEMERHYSPGRTWQSLAVGLAALLRPRRRARRRLGRRRGGGLPRPVLPLAHVHRHEPADDRSRARAPRRASRTCGPRWPTCTTCPFGAASFDSILLFHTLTYAEKPQRALEECARVLRPGGRVVVLTLDAHEQRDVTAPYGERHAGFSPRALKSLLTRAGLAVTFADVACREAKKPHFEVVLSDRREGRTARAKTPKQVES